MSRSLSRLFRRTDTRPAGPVGPRFLAALGASTESLAKMEADLERLGQSALALEREGAALGPSHPFPGRMRRANRELAIVISKLGTNTTELSRALDALRSAASTLKAEG